MLCGLGASSFLFSIISIVSIVRGKLKSSTASHSTQLNSPEGMQCVLKKIMNCHEVPYSLIIKKPRHIHNLSVHGLGADFIIF